MRRLAPPGIIATLAGSWRLTRTVDNGASMTGIAAFGDRGDGHFNYREQGRLRLPGGGFIDAERRYVFTDEDGGFAVWFAENPPRLFHRVVLARAGSRLVGQARHLCGEDRYDSRYEFVADDAFRVEHAVRDPRKRYAMSSGYALLMPDADDAAPKRLTENEVGRINQ